MHIYGFLTHSLDNIFFVDPCVTFLFTHLGSQKMEPLFQRKGSTLKFWEVCWEKGKIRKESDQLPAWQVFVTGLSTTAKNEDGIMEQERGIHNAFMNTLCHFGFWIEAMFVLSTTLRVKVNSAVLFPPKGVSSTKEREGEEKCVFLATAILFEKFQFSALHSKQDYPLLPLQAPVVDN